MNTTRDLICDVRFDLVIVTLASNEVISIAEVTFASDLSHSHSLRFDLV